MVLPFCARNCRSLMERKQNPEAWLIVWKDVEAPPRSHSVLYHFQSCFSLHNFCWSQIVKTLGRFHINTHTRQEYFSVLTANFFEAFPIMDSSWFTFVMLETLASSSTCDLALYLSLAVPFLSMARITLWSFPPSTCIERASFLYSLPSQA